MNRSRIPSPARSQGAPMTPRRYKRRSRSVASPSRSQAQTRMSEMIQEYREEQELPSYRMSPLPKRQSVLTDDTNIEEPRRKSWYKKLNESPVHVKILDNNKTAPADVALEDLFNIEVASQQTREGDISLDLPESSDGESIHSIVMPQRRLCVQKENKTIKKLVDSSKFIKEKSIFTKKPKSVTNTTSSAVSRNSIDKTIDLTKELAAVKNKGGGRNLLDRNPPREVNFTIPGFTSSEGEDEISEIQIRPRAFAFNRRSVGSRRSRSSIQSGNVSPSSIIDDMDSWRLLPSSTMVENALDIGGTPIKKGKYIDNRQVQDENKSQGFNENNEEKYDYIEKTLKAMEAEDEVDTVRTCQNVEEVVQIDIVEKHTLKLDSIQNTQNKTIQSVQDIHKDDSIIKRIENQAQSSVHGKMHVMSTQSEEVLNKTKEDLIRQDIQNIIIGEQNLPNELQTQSLVDQQNRSKRQDGQKSEIETNKKYSEETQINQDVDVPIGVNKQNRNSEIKDKSMVQEHEEYNLKVKQISDHLIQNENLDPPKENMVSENESVKEPESNKDVENAYVQGHDRDSRNHDILIEEEAQVKQNDQVGIDAGVNNDNIDAQRRNLGSFTEMKKKDEHNLLNSDNKMQNENSVGQNDSISHYSKQNNKNHSMLPNNRSMKEKECNEKSKQETTDKEIQCEKLSKVTKHAALEEEIQYVKSNDKILQEECYEEMELDASGEAVEPGEFDRAIECGESNEEIESKDIEHEASNEDIQPEECDDEIEREESIEEIEHEVTDEEIERGESIEEIERGESIEEIEHEGSDEEIEREESNEEIEHEGSNEEIERGESTEEVEHEESNEEFERDESNEEVDYEVFDEEIGNEESNKENQLNSVNNQNQSVVQEDDCESGQDNEQEQSIEQDSQENEEEETEQMEQSQDESQEDSDKDDDEDLRLEYNDKSDQENVQNESITSQSNEEDIELQPNTNNDATLYKTHDTTGRKRKRDDGHDKTPEAILHGKSKQMDSFIGHGRNTSIRKTMLKQSDIRQSLDPVRESFGGDASKNSSAEGSEWDSHRTTRKTLRQTFGKDFTPRKSLRALVMEKSAKRQTAITEGNADITKYPLANSTELPDPNAYLSCDSEMIEETEHDMSKRTRQTTLETYLEKLRMQNMEKRKEMEDVVKKSLKPPQKDILNKISNFASYRPRVKVTKSKPKTVRSSGMALAGVPHELIDDLSYKPPKRFQPRNAPWVTKRLYKFLETKLEPRYDYKARVRAEHLMEKLYNFAKEARKRPVADTKAVDTLKQDMARLQIVKTHFDFYEFIGEYLPREIKIKVVPDIVNNIPKPRDGIFSEILLTTGHH